MRGAGAGTWKSVVRAALPAGGTMLLGPMVATKGTRAQIWAAAVTENSALMLMLNSTCVAPVKLKPLIVTKMFVALRAGSTSVMRGATTKLLLLSPKTDGETETRIFPVVASGGTVATMRFTAVTMKSATVPLNSTFVAELKSDPLITTCVPGLPEPGEKLATDGAAWLVATRPILSAQMPALANRMLFTRIALTPLEA